MLAGSLQCQFVAIGSKSKQTTLCDVTEKTNLAKLFPSESVAQVNFYKRNGYSQKCIAQRNTGVGKATRVQDDKVDVFPCSLLNPVDKLVLALLWKHSIE